MHKYIARLLVAVAASVALSTVGVTGAGASRAAPEASLAPKTDFGGASQGPSSPGSKLWVARYDGSGNGSEAHAVAVSPTGATVFVTGQSYGTNSGYDYATVAYNAATGARLWVARYNGPAHNPNLALDADMAYSVGVSPDGGTVFVTGQSYGTNSGYDYATVAYNAETGARLWVARYNGPGNSSDIANAMVVSPTGETVFVTGLSLGATSGYGYATVAYNAATGAQQWVARYNGRGNGAQSLAVSPHGDTVFVTGYSLQTSSDDSYATIAYNAATGAQQWVARYNGPGNSSDIANAIVVSPAGGTVYVTGQSYTTSSGDDYATVAYNAATGAQQWVARYNGPGNGQDIAYSVVVSPAGGTVYVTGASAGYISGDDYATIAYNAATGAQQWLARYNGPGNGQDIASSVAVSPTGATVYVTGRSDGTSSSSDYATVAYNAATGAQQWVARYNGPGNGKDAASAVAVSPTGGTVFVTGYSLGNDLTYDYATVAYHG
jgi:hypothetical protein